MVASLHPNLLPYRTDVEWMSLIWTGRMEVVKKDIDGSAHRRLKTGRKKKTASYTKTRKVYFRPKFMVASLPPINSITEQVSNGCP